MCGGAVPFYWWAGLSDGAAHRPRAATGGHNESGPRSRGAGGSCERASSRRSTALTGQKRTSRARWTLVYPSPVQNETYEKWARRDHRRLRAVDPHDPPGRHHHCCQPTGSAGGQHQMASAGDHARRVKAAPPIRRNTPSRSKRDCARGAEEAGITSPDSGSPARRCRPGSSRASTRASTTRCSADLNEIGTEARSMDKCQERASCSRCRHRRRRPPISSSRRRWRARWRDGSRCSTASTPAS